MAHIISDGETSDGINIENGDIMTVLDGGIATTTTVNSWSSMFVSSGGTANSTTINAGGGLYVSSGGTATDIIWTPCEGHVSVDDGAVVTFVSEYSGVYFGSDNQLLSHAATMEEKQIGESCEMIVMSDGFANKLNISDDGWIYVSSGGTANNTLILGNENDYDEGGYLTVFYSGTANNTTVNAGGGLYVSSGGTANNTTVNAGGFLGVYGGTAINTLILGNENDYDEFGYLTVFYSGTANSTTINAGGGLYVSSGGTANTTTVNSGGWIYVSSGGTANSTTINAGGRFYVSSGGTANSTIVNGNGYLEVFSGGTANSTTINAGGGFYVYSGGMANKTTVNSGGSLFISSGVTANSTIVNGDMYVSSGGTANRTTVNPGGDIYVSQGGTATAIIENGGYVHVDDGANVTFLANTFSNLELHGTATIHSGTTANDTTVNDGGCLEVHSGGTAANIDMVNGARFNFRVAPDTYVQGTAGGSAFEMKDASISNYVVNYGGSIYVCSGGSAYSTTVNNGGMYVSSGGTANNTTLNSGGSLYLSSGGTTNNTICGGVISVFKGGTANSTTVNDGGHLVIWEGTANNTTVNNGGIINVAPGGTATGIIENGGYVYCDGANVTFLANTFSNLELHGSATIHSGTTANSTTVNGNGYLEVFSGGTANSTTVNNGGIINVAPGGTANSTTVNNGGIINVARGGKLTGRMSFEDDAIVSAEAEAILDFDLTQTTAGEKALVNDLSLVQGAPIYTLTVDGTQDTGTYRLADGVSMFTNMISVMNTSGEQIGSLMVGQKLETEYADYTLKISNGGLTVTVSATGVVPPAGDTVAPTDPTGLRAFVDGQDVALVWSVSTDDTGVKEYIVKYSLDGEIFTARTTIPHYVLNNADYGTWSWSVQAVDFAGNESAVTVGDAFTVSEFKPYTVEYSADNFEHTIRFTVSSPTLNSFRMPGGAYQMRVMAADSGEWMEGDPIEAETFGDTPQLVKSDADGNADVFFAHAVGAWESAYLAHHTGSVNDWRGTNEYAMLYGKNRFADIFEGSDDANILLLTDGDNGDALFVDDIYSASPDKLGLSQARIARIDEIRAGSGDDIVDTTSRKFEYIGDGLTIRGGEGDDVIWANKGDNMLFGDAGNDRIVGASGDDVIAGGIGNDRMHGGGGDDVFTFCDNWGTDNVEQRADGFVTLWFASGSESNWNAETLTYTDGENSIKVSGIAAEQVALKFGDDGSAQFAALNSAGAFFDATSERIFEESGKGMLASL